MTDFSKLYEKLFGAGPRQSAADTLKKAMDSVGVATYSDSHETIAILRLRTTDTKAQDICDRALGVYLAAVRCVTAGGRVQFVDKDGGVKTLRVRVK